MGLDMYLTKKTSVKNWSFNKDYNFKVSALNNGVAIPHIKTASISWIKEDFMYWRKANQIHEWFVMNVQEGEDDCREYKVTWEQLKELKDTCKKVVESLEKSGVKTVKVESGGANGVTTYSDKKVFKDTKTADELLPTQSGFFFGSDLYDEWYLEQLEETIKVIEEAEKHEKLFNDLFVTFHYQSSW